MLQLHYAHKCLAVLVARHIGGDYRTAKTLMNLEHNELLKLAEGVPAWQWGLPLSVSPKAMADIRPDYDAPEPDRLQIYCDWAGIPDQYYEKDLSKQFGRGLVCLTRVCTTAALRAASDSLNVLGKT